MQLSMAELKKLTNEEIMFFVMYLFATLLGTITVFIILSVYNNTDFFFLNTDDMKFYGLFITGFAMCAIVMSSAINYSGWNNFFIILSILIGIAILITFTMFIFNINIFFLDSKVNFIYVLGFLLFSKVGIATIQRVVVLLT